MTSLVDRSMEGSQARLPAPSPRGTERDSFPSLGSSSTKASVNQSRPGDSECSPSDLRDTHPQPLYMSFDNAGGAHAQWCSVHLLSPTLTVL